MSERDHFEKSIQRLGLTPSYLSFSRRAILGMISTAFLGGAAAVGAASLYTNGAQRFLLAYLVALAFVLSLSLGSLFFILIQHLTRAGWAVLIRRPAEVFALNIVTVGLLSLPILWTVHQGVDSIYPWARSTELATNGNHGNETDQHSNSSELHPVQSAHLVSANADVSDVQSAESSESHENSAHGNNELGHLYVHQQFDRLTASKTDWLNPGFFTTRLLIYFVLWIFIAGFYFRHSRQLDENGGVDSTQRMERWAGPCILIFGLTVTFAAFDLLMSLDPHWYSTIFGVYYFAGCAVGGFAVSLLSWLILSRLDFMPTQVSASHLRDLGRLLFAFVFFWGYIAFSQYMLLWYANVPETTRWWAVRGASLAEEYTNSWGIILIILLLGHFVIPFLGIMSRHVKDHRKAMLFWTVWLLVMHYVDLYWLVMPEFRMSIAFGLPEIGALLLVGGIYAIGASYLATRTSLIPVGDPRVASSLGLSDAY